MSGHSAQALAPFQFPGLSLRQVQMAALWLFVASGFFVLIEPAPYELLFAVTLLLFLPHGLTASAFCAPLVLFLILFNVGGVASAIPFTNDKKVVEFIAVSIYLAITAMFFAFAVTREPVRTVLVIKNAYICAAVIASVIAVAGYFDVAGLASKLSPISRAQGTFKDPNVLSAFLIPPAMFLLHGILTGRQRYIPVAIVSFLIIALAIFLAFSRGAWVNAAVSTITLSAVLFVMAPSIKERTRISLLLIFGSLALFAMLSIALTFPNVRELFAERANLFQSYDSGETGRFGDQINSLPMLLELPNGFGPRQFREVFEGDPHNVYINAFAAYGWLGGISYILLVLMTMWAGWRSMFAATPWQTYSIMFFCPTFVVMLQGVQIDTDHWRHFYLLLGVTWGLYAASELHIRRRTRTLPE